MFRCGWVGIQVLDDETDRQPQLHLWTNRPLPRPLAIPRVTSGMADRAPIGPDEGQPNIRGLRVGQKVGAGRFTLTQPLGEGGRGVVWKAADSTLGGMVAVKFLPPEIAGDPTAIEDLRKETAQSRRLSHPNVVRVYDLFEDMSPFIFMELVEGHTLAQERLLHPRKVLPWSYVAPLVAQLCDALDYAHSEKVIHRDLKPNNVLIDARRSLVKLVDFGIARVMTESVTRVTQRTIPDGTIVYMSCQQLNGEGASPVDDIYSLGVTLYEILTGKPPFHSGDIPWQIRYGDLALISTRLGELELENDVPPYVEEAVMACLARDPFKRPQTARETAERLGLYDAGTNAARTPRPATTRRGLENGPAGFVTPTISEANPAHADAGEPTPKLRPTDNGDAAARYPEPGLAEPVSKATDTSSLVPQGRVEEGRRGGKWMVVVLALLALAAALYWVKVSAPTKDGQEPTKVRLYAALLQHLGATSGPASEDPQGNGQQPSQTTLTNGVVASNHLSSPAAVNTTPQLPRRGASWTNTLGMVFVPVPGADVLVACWETRVKDYAAFAQALGETGDDRWQSPGFAQDENHPVVFATWTNAMAFCAWLTTSEREQGRLGEQQVYRLPADPEWSQAAGLLNEPGADPLDRARRQASIARFSWGTNWPPQTPQANLRGLEVRHQYLGAACVEMDDGFVGTSPVDSFEPTDTGLHDLTGNVWEWCQDSVGITEANRIVRGGSWDTFREEELLLSHRDHFGAGTRLARVGFRCVLDPGTPE